PDLKLSNQTRYSQNGRESIVTTPGTNAASYDPATGLLTRSRQANKRDTDILSNQTNVTGDFATGSIKHDVAGGLELTRETAYSPAFTSTAEAPIPIQSPHPNGTPTATPFRSNAYTDATTKTAAVYAFDTLKFSEHWQANLSARAENYQTNYLSVATTLVPTTAEAKDTLFSWKTGLVYKPVTVGSIYIAYDNSMTPPGTDFTLSTVAGNQNNPSTEPQKTISSELGVKWEFFRGKLITTAALFKTVNDNTVFTDPILGAIPTGKQTVQGLELGATGKITDDWLVIGSFSYLDSKIDNGITSGNNLAGASLPLIPTYSGNLWTSYQLPNQLIIGGGSQYFGGAKRRDASISNAPRDLPSYWLFNALVAYPLTRHVNIRLNVNNVFDEKYVQSYNNNGARFSPGAPRSYLVSADFKY
ncbi:MAG: TonB-dependent receptor, partial [Opitutaceae bacterium]